MKLYCPDGHVTIEVSDDWPVRDDLECATCLTPLTRLAPLKTCHPEFGCSCVEVDDALIERIASRVIDRIRADELARSARG